VIPDTVELTDFLSHRCANGEPVVFDFDGAVLWSVSGDNGAGKSAIFDAITWTLFNEHRGGSQDAKRLISHGADRAAAAFVFTLDGERYRVERSLRRRGAAKRSASRWDTSSQTWREIPDTTAERGFARWRDEALGLSYAAFTQSVLLLQGDSDRLIRAGSRERFEILAQLVDLSSYRALEDRARERASQARGAKSTLKQDVEGLSPVDADERKAATAEVKRLESERKAREGLRQAQAAVVVAAREHEKLGQRLAATRAEIEVAAEALAVADHADELIATARKQLEEIDLESYEQAATAARHEAAKAKAAGEEANRQADRLRRALPNVETAIFRRRELAEIEAALQSTGASADAARALKACDRVVEDMKRVLDEAREVERDTRARLSGLEAAIALAKQEIAEIRSGVAEVTCSRCGQEVPEGQREAHLSHTESELEERLEERDAARDVLDRLVAAREAAEQAVEAKGAERARLALTAERAAEHEQARVRARRAVQSALKARGLASWEDERATHVKDGSVEGLEQLLGELRAEAEHLQDEADRLVAQVEPAGQAAAVAEVELLRARERRASLELALRKAELEAQTQRQERLTQLRGAAAELERQLGEVPTAHRVPVEEAEAELERRKAAVDEIAQLVEQAKAQLRDLDRREEVLREKREDLERAERMERLATRMATLLGRQGLQGQLLAHAARHLEALANDTLHALTGGTLSLEIRPDERRNRDEITISARDFDAGGERTDASFLSGSEKFRVCVAMAAAIGKYASGRASIESLIVDEGFGSLDEVGRDDMIDELQRLAQLLRRVIVVSHQGEFQDRTRFPHGYRLRRTERATEIERYL
jgi:DNA repair protein SbcC/Rad50